MHLRRHQRSDSKKRHTSNLPAGLTDDPRQFRGNCGCAQPVLQQPHFSKLKNLIKSESLTRVNVDKDMQRTSRFETHNDSRMHANTCYTLLSVFPPMVGMYTCRAAEGGSMSMRKIHLFVTANRQYLPMRFRVWRDLYSTISIPYSRIVYVQLRCSVYLHPNPA